MSKNVDKTGLPEESCMSVVNTPCNDKSVNENYRFWNELVRMVNVIGNGHRVMFMVDLKRGFE